jgi:hypothetical protein
MIESQRKVPGRTPFEGPYGIVCSLEAPGNPTNAAGRGQHTARALGEISGHWDAVYEAMRRKDQSQEAAEH